MKAVVVDIKGKSAIALSKDGQFIKIKNTDMAKIGNEVDVPIKAMPRLNGFMMKGIAAAAVFTFTLSLGYGAYSYNMPFSYINVDINPSMEIVANRFDRILKVEAINDDGAKLLENNNYKNKSIDFAIGEIIKDATSQGYIKQDTSNAVMLTISSKDEKKVEQVEKKVQKAAKTEIDSDNVKADIIVESVTIKRHDEARELDISPGKLTLIEKLQGVVPDTKIEDYKNSTVKEIMKAINDQKKDEVKEEKNIDTNQKNNDENDIKDKSKVDKDNETKPDNNTDKGKNEKSIGNDKSDIKITKQNDRQEKNEQKRDINNKPNSEDSKDKDKNNNTSKNSGKDNGRNK